MKRNAKKTVVVIALIALMAIPSMLAYFTDTENTSNTFTTGDIEVALDASNITAATDVVPNQPLGNATVENSSAKDNDAHVFVKVDTNKKFVDFVVNSDVEAVEADVYYLGKMTNADAPKNIFTTLKVKENLKSFGPETVEGVEDLVANENVDVDVDLTVYAIQADYLAAEAEGQNLSAAELWALYGTHKY